MTGDILNKKYFNWMCSIVCGENKSLSKTYGKLLSYLHERDFHYTIDLDGNRESDGIDLRYHFGHEKGYQEAMIASYLDNRPCSILEMMVALANRCEVQIMDEPELGDRTGRWFWDMIFNLGLINMTDDRYDQYRVESIIDTFLDREYKPNGEGGLFIIDNCRHDLRDVEIWCQMCWYLNEI